MLFNSHAFIFAFLPVVLLGFYLVGKSSHSLSAIWLAAASLFFYGWWDFRYLGLLLASIAFNFGAGFVIGHMVSRNKSRRPMLLLASAIAINLSFLAYFKYANFFVDNLNQLTGSSLVLATVILPLGISFFTFTQIAFLVDTYQGKAKEFNFVHYALFVSYFPHLIAGPVLHHAEMMPQFSRRTVCRINWDNMAVGLSFFVLGLAKKVLLADSVADYSTPVFDSIEAGGSPMLFESWGGALAYTLQLYFDFSAYSDMAIGLSLMFNIRLPLNFNSPYKATSIIEFWRRWHMTLSRFLRDYLYISLGGSRRGPSRRYVNLMLTMILGGLWHGAGWTFVIWGALHGFYLLVNHAWRGLKSHMRWNAGGRVAALGSRALTFLAVVVGWVFFRSESISSAVIMLQGMIGLNGIVRDWLPVREAFGLVIPCLLWVFVLPNVQEIFHRYRPSFEKVPQEKSGTTLNTPPAHKEKLVDYLQWFPSKTSAWAIAIIFYFSVMNLSNVSEFLYFKF